MKNKKIFSQESIERQEQSMKALAHIIKTFETISANGARKKYNDYYAGAYLDEKGYLNICTAGLDILDVGEYAENVIHRKYKYSYNYLDSIVSLILPFMNEFNICGIGVSEKENLVKVNMIDSEKAHKFSDFLRKQGVCADDLWKIETGMNAILA